MKVETLSCNNLLLSFRVFTTPGHSDCSRKDPMNPTFPSIRTVARDAATNFQVFSPPRRDPLLGIVHQTFLWLLCSISENSSSIHDWSTGRVFSNKTFINLLLISTAYAGTSLIPQLFSHIWPQDIEQKKFPSNLGMSMGFKQVPKWVQRGLLQLTALIIL